MLTSTFCCFEGLSGAAERRLWKAGCLNWKELELLDGPLLSARKLAHVRSQIAEARIALDAGLADYFINRLRAPDTIRILPHFRDATGYLDIETTGLAASDRITTVALWSKGRARAYVRGMNLGQLLRDLAGLSLLVTFNGASFDLPRLRSEFRINLAKPHVDLRECLAALGIRGGLKQCEEQLGFTRREAQSLTGADAVQHWRRYEREGHRQSLLALLRYNLQDALSLEILAAQVYDRVMSCFPLALRFPRRSLPDPATLDLKDVL